MGRFLDEEDLALRRKVCVVGHEVFVELLESRPSIADVSITADGQVWQVVGVLKDKPLLGGGGFGTWMWNRKVLVPHTTYNAIYSPPREVARVFVSIGDSDDLQARMHAAEKIVRGTLLRRHLGVENFKIEGEDGQANQQRLILGIIKMLLLATGLLSLFVGGINIMNIMLVTVTERTREIGVRRAIGASPGAILEQFLLEASLIALTGGVIGVAGGVLITWLAALGLQHWLGAWKFHVEAWSIGLGLALSLATGIAFGIFPALRAARLDPVEALRYE
jgi:putative ABC transport system permease protein